MLPTLTLPTLLLNVSIRVHLTGGVGGSPTIPTNGPSRGIYGPDDGREPFYFRLGRPTGDPEGGDWNVHPPARLGVMAASGFQPEAGKVALQGSPSASPQRARRASIGGSGSR